MMEFLVRAGRKKNRLISYSCEDEKDRTKALIRLDVKKLELVIKKKEIFGRDFMFGCISIE